MTFVTCPNTYAKYIWDYRTTNIVMFCNDMKSLYCVLYCNFYSHRTKYMLKTPQGCLKVIKV